MILSALYSCTIWSLHETQQVPSCSKSQWWCLWTTMQVAEWLHSRCPPDDGLCSFCAGYAGHVECPAGLHKSNLCSSFPALFQSLWGFPGSPLYLETKPCIQNALLPLGMLRMSWAPHAMLLLFRFPKHQAVASSAIFFLSLWNDYF